MLPLAGQYVRRDEEVCNDSGYPMKRLVRFTAVSMVLVAGLGLAACGSSPSVSPTTTSTGPSSQVPYLCQVIPRIDRLIVTRTALTNQFHFTFPGVVTVTNAAAAQAVATAACALPDAPKDAQSCPAEFAISYRLFFAVRGEKGMGGEYIDVNPTGCQLVTGLGTVREATTHPAFYRLLGNAMGLKNANYLTFRQAPITAS
jgi:hypothetical protein